MGFCRKSYYFNRLILSGVLTSFSLACIPTPAYSQVNIDLNEIQFAYDMEQIIEKIYKAADKEDGNKAIDLMMQAKQKVEAYTGKSIDLDKQIDQVEKEIKQKGAKIPKKEFSALRKKLKKSEKRQNHRAMHMETCYYADIPYNPLEENELFMARHGHKKDDEAEIIIPIRLTVGVTVALVGLFIMVIPIIPPPIKPYGARMVGYGAALAAEACYSCFDENQKKK